MSRRKQRTRVRMQMQNGRRPCRNQDLFKALLDWLIPQDELFTKDHFHGNTSWRPEQLAQQAVIWAWQETRNVTDAFTMAQETCQQLNMKQVANTYVAFIDALVRHRETFQRRLGRQLQTLAEEVAGRFWRDDGWVLMGFDGSRTTAPRSVSNEKEFCAPNYGKGRTAKYRKKKSKGMRRCKNEKNPPQPQAPQAWITMMWHMGSRLPWSWRLGPSNSSERRHVTEMVQQEELPENTLFCGDAGFVGFDFWKAIVDRGGNFLVRVGGNVNLLSEEADIEQRNDGIVLCWPKGKMNSGVAPLRLRLVKVKIGKTTMWLLTSVLDRRKLPKRKMVKYYKMRWGVEVEFRGLKQTVDKRRLRCRNAARAHAELDWSIRAMAFAELIALREQIPDDAKARSPSEQPAYDTKCRSLANTMRALRTCLRNLHKTAEPNNDVLCQLSRALVPRYTNHTDKQSRYRPPNPDNKPLGEPAVRQLTRAERTKLKQTTTQVAA